MGWAEADAPRSVRTSADAIKDAFMSLILEMVAIPAFTHAMRRRSRRRACGVRRVNRGRKAFYFSRNARLA
jgi:hypothetical protein